jgi:chromosomal replication initiation ATPase DnaA
METMTEAERQARDYAQVRARLFPKGKIVNIHNTAILAQKKAERRKRIERQRWKELKQETEARRRLKPFGLDLETFSELYVDIAQEEQQVAATVDAKMPMAMIAKSVMFHYPEYTLEEIQGPGRSRQLVKIRYEIIRSIGRLRPDLSTVQIGRFINRDHSTVVFALGRRERKPTYCPIEEKAQ